MSPYSGRGANSSSNTTSPFTPVTLRSSAPGASGPSSWPRSLRPTASASTTTAVPDGVRCVVSSTIAWGT